MGTCQQSSGCCTKLLPCTRVPCKATHCHSHGNEHEHSLQDASEDDMQHVMHRDVSMQGSMYGRAGTAADQQPLSWPPMQGARMPSAVVQAQAISHVLL